MELQLKGLHRYFLSTIFPANKDIILVLEIVDSPFVPAVGYLYKNIQRSSFSLIGTVKDWDKFLGIVGVSFITTSSDYLRVSHCFGGHSGGVLCTFISESRMFSMLKRLDPTAHKGEDHMITGNSFVFPTGNGFKNALDLLATRSSTRPVFLDLGGARNSFWKWRFKIPNMKPITLPLGSFTCWIISQVLVSGLRTEYQLTSTDDDRLGSIWDGYKDEEMLER